MRLTYYIHTHTHTHYEKNWLIQVIWDVRIRAHTHTQECSKLRKNSVYNVYVQRVGYQLGKFITCLITISDVNNVVWEMWMKNNSYFSLLWAYQLFWFSKCHSVVGLGIIKTYCKLIVWRSQHSASLQLSRCFLAINDTTSRGPSTNVAFVPVTCITCIVGSGGRAVER